MAKKGTILTAKTAKKLHQLDNHGQGKGTGLDQTREKIVTRPIVEWLDQNSRVPVTPEDMPFIEEIMLDTSGDERTNRFGSSSRGQCLRAQVFQYLGHKSDESPIDYQLANIFIDGQWRHLRWQLIMLKAGVIDRAEAKFEIPELRLKCSIDGDYAERDYFVEIKGDGTFKDVDKPTEAHALQIATYFLVSGYSKCVYFVEQKRSQEWYEVVVKPEVKLMRAVEDELRKLNKAIDEETLPEVLASCKQQKGPWKKCKYRNACIGVGWEEAQGATAVTIGQKPIESQVRKSRIRKK